MAISLDAWKAKVLEHHPRAEFTLEDGTGKTYGDEGQTTAHTGPDMQADVVGCYVPEGEWGWYWKDGQSYDAETDEPESPPGLLPWVDTP